MRKIGSYIGRGVRSVSGTLNPFGGAVDIIVVKQPDGSLKSSPWYVKFGKFQGVLKTQENVVNVSVNGVESGFNMNIDGRGQAYFLRELGKEDGDSLITRTSEELTTLNLKEGKNVVVFTCSRQQVDARIYLWRWDTKIVVSDVDGTITRSDVLGQFMPLVGMDWSHTGVAQLFSAIKENGYQLLFQSARSISQAYLTRQFLFNLMQDGKGLPEGPVLTSPDGLFRSLVREVVMRSPHEFKITCLQDVKSLFPSDRNPFYAGFGNRDTDKVSYLKVGIPEGKIFTIDPKGQIVMNHINTKSYTDIHGRVDKMFPPLSSSEQICYGQSVVTKRRYFRVCP